MADVVLNLKAINDQLMKALAESEAAFRKLSEAAKKTNTQVEKTGTSTKQAGGSMSAFWGAATGAGLATIALDVFKKVAGAVKDFGIAAVQAAAEFENISVVLTNSLGSSSAAASVLKMLGDFTKSTPITMKEATDAYLRFANMGVYRTREELTKLGDLAVSQNKSFSEITEASLQAQTGQFSRLRTFGIEVKKVGDNIALTFKGQTQVIKNNAKAIDDAILKMGTYNGVSGGMKAVAETLTGKISELKNGFNDFSASVGAKALPLLKNFIDVLIKFIDKLDINEIMANFAPITQVLIPALSDLLTSIQKLGGAQQEWNAQSAGVNVLNKAFLDLVDTLNLVIRTVNVVLDLLGSVKFSNSLTQNAQGVAGALAKFRVTGLSNSKDVQKNAQDTVDLNKYINEVIGSADQLLLESIKSSKNLTGISKEQQKAIDALAKAYENLKKRAEQSNLRNLTGVDRIKEEARLAKNEINQLEKNLQKLANKAGRSLSNQSLAYLKQLRSDIESEKKKKISDYTLNQLEDALKQEEDIATKRIDLIEKSGDEELTLTEFKEQKKLEIQKEYAEQRLLLYKNDPTKQDERETLQTQIDILNKQLADVKGSAKSEYTDNLLKELAFEQDIAEQRVELITVSSDKELTLEEYKEKRKLQIQLEYAKIRLNLVKNDPAREQEKKGLETTIELLDKAISEIGKKAEAYKSKNILKELFMDALKIDEAQADEIISSFESVYSSLIKMAQEQTQAQIDENEKYISKLNERSEQTSKALEEEQAKAAKGYNNNVQAKKNELSQIQREQEAATAKQLALKKKALQQEILADSISQGSSIITMAANAVAAYSPYPFVGIALATASIAGFLALFASIKSKQDQIGNLSEGGAVSQYLNGQTDKYGQKGYAVTDTEGNTVLRIGGDEFVMNGSASSKYRPYLESMNAGTFPVSGIMGDRAEKYSNKIAASNYDTMRNAYADVMGEYIKADHRYWSDKPDRIGSPDDYMEIRRNKKTRYKKV